MFRKFAGKDKPDPDTSATRINAKKMGTHDVWISRDEMVDFLLYAASFEASVATRSNISIYILNLFPSNIA